MNKGKQSPLTGSPIVLGVSTVGVPLAREPLRPCVGLKSHLEMSAAWGAQQGIVRKALPLGCFGSPRGSAP